MAIGRKESGSLVKKAGKVLVDLALNLSSNRPIANSAVTAKFNQVESALTGLIIYVDSDLQTIAMTADGYFTKDISLTVPSGYTVIGATFINYLSQPVVGNISCDNSGGVYTKFLSRYNGNFTYKVRLICKKN